MKKLLAVLAALIVGASAVSALTIEVDAMYLLTYDDVYISKSGGIEFAKDYKPKQNYFSPFGLGGNANIYFAETGMFQIGANFAAGFDIGRLLSYSKINKTEYRADGKGIWGGGGFMKIGFAMSINIDKTHSVYVSPGFIFFGATAGHTEEILGIKYKSRVSTVLVGLDIDLGYRAWLKRDSDFDLGICCGLVIDAPIGGGIINTQTVSDTTTTIKGNGAGAGFKLYVGPCFKFDI